MIKGKYNLIKQLQDTLHIFCCVSTIVSGGRMEITGMRSVFENLSG